MTKEKTYINYKIKIKWIIKCNFIATLWDVNPYFLCLHQMKIVKKNEKHFTTNLILQQQKSIFISIQWWQKQQLLTFGNEMKIHGGVWITISVWKIKTNNILYPHTYINTYTLNNSDKRTYLFTFTLSFLLQTHTLGNFLFRRGRIVGNILRICFMCVSLYVLCVQVNVISRKK